MQLETITANIRSRSPWEAIDLGFAMVRSWWISIYTPLAILVLGLIAALSLLIPYQYYWISLLVLWWLKPLYHRLILHVISRQVFGHSLSWSTSLKALPELLLRTGLISELTWRRFSLTRGFQLPIWQLERLRGKDRSQRQRLLLGNVHSAAVWLNIAIFSFQMILSASFLLLIWMFVPEHYAEELFYKLVSNQLTGVGYFIEIIAVFGFLLVMVFLEPFYIAASFSMYLNRRTQLEAWDIELEFRKMANRLEALKSKLGLVFTGMVIALVLSGLPSQPLLASEPENTLTTPHYEEQLSETRHGSDEAIRVINEVMQNEHLHQEKLTKRWRLKTSDDQPELDDSSSPWLESFSSIFAALVEYALWIAIAVGIFVLYIYRKSWLPLLVRLPEETESLSPDILFGMDVRKESLPDDVIAAAKDLWIQGKPRDALSLLYRCALAQLISNDQLPLEHSHTEGDILKLSRSVLTSQRQHYLERLTDSWVKIAYAHESPSDPEMSYLLDHWSNDFATGSIGKYS